MAAALCVGGCSTEVGYDTVLMVKATTQSASNAEAELLHDALFHAYRADTALYAPASYADALEGILTHRQDPEQKIAPDWSSEPYYTVSLGELPGARITDVAQLLLLVVDPQDRLYGYTQLAMAENLPQMYVSLAFQPWKQSYSYKNGNWWMFNEFYVPTISCSVSFRQQSAEGEEATSIHAVKLFAFEVEQAEGWAPADFTDAVVGRLTHESGAIADFAYSATSNSQGKASFSFPQRDYLLLAVTAEECCYALRWFRAEESETGDLSLLFQPWQPIDTPYYDNEWTVVNTYKAPEESEENPDQGEETPVEGEEPALH